MASDKCREWVTEAILFRQTQLETEISLQILVKIYEKKSELLQCNVLHSLFLLISL